MLKQFRKDALKEIEKDFTFSKKEVIFHSANFDTRLHSNDRLADMKDPNLTERIHKFTNQVQSKYAFRILLRYPCNLGRINLAIEIDLKLGSTLET